ncbi:recombinase family protein [Actinomycetes bacterium KLBMP 9797]
MATYTCARAYSDVAWQEARLRAFLDTRPEWRLTASYLDVRPRSRGRGIQLRRALRDASQGRFDVLLIDSTSRLTRDSSELLAIIGELDAVGVAMCSATENFDTGTPIGRFTTQLLAAVTAYEAVMRDRKAGLRVHRTRADRGRRRRPRTRRVHTDHTDGGAPDR